jgi:hypothetical protein
MRAGLTRDVDACEIASEHCWFLENESRDGRWISWTIPHDPSLTRREKRLWLGEDASKAPRVRAKKATRGRAAERAPAKDQRWLRGKLRPEAGDPVERPAAPATAPISQDAATPAPALEMTFRIARIMNGGDAEHFLVTTLDGENGTGGRTRDRAAVAAVRCALGCFERSILSGETRVDPAVGVDFRVRFVEDGRVYREVKEAVAAASKEK